MALGASLTQNHQQTTLQYAALAGKLDVVKRFVAMSETAPTISGELLVALLDDSDLTLSVQLKKKRQEVASYLFNEGKWDTLSLSRALFNLGKAEGVEQWLIKQKKAIHNNFDVEQFLRIMHTQDQLREAVAANDVDTLELLFKHYQQPTTQIGYIADYVLPADVSQAFKSKLRKNDLEAVSETLTWKNPEVLPYILDTLLNANVPALPKEAPMLVKFLELGVDLIEFEKAVAMPVEQWCKENFCEDVLSLENMQERVAKLKVARLLENLTTTTDKAKAESELLDYTKTYGVKFLSDAFLAISFKLAPHSTNLATLLGRNNMADLLKQPGVLAVEMKSKELHDTILQLANENHPESVDVLVSHARRYRPDALRFSKEEIAGVNTINQNIADNLKHAFEPKKPAQSLYSYVTSAFGFGEQDPTDDASDDLDVEPVKMKFKMMF